MPRVGFERTIPVFEQAKTVHALDRAGTVIGARYTLNGKKETNTLEENYTYLDYMEKIFNI
jgi:muramoyltetrapeptide carboxypeptidase LdcA involved in peptidoglycan recycling